MTRPTQAPRKFLKKRFGTGVTHIRHSLEMDSTYTTHIRLRFDEDSTHIRISDSKDGDNRASLSFASGYFCLAGDLKQQGRFVAESDKFDVLEKWDPKSPFAVIRPFVSAAQPESWATVSTATPMISICLE